MGPNLNPNPITPTLTQTLAPTLTLNLTLNSELDKARRLRLEAMRLRQEAGIETARCGAEGKDLEPGGLGLVSKPKPKPKAYSLSQSLTL